MSDAPKFVACGEYLPDQPDFQNPGISIANNVVPRTTSTYSPFPAFATSAATALNGPPLGAFSSHDTAGNPAMYAGTTTKLYSTTNATNPNFTDRSGAATFAVPAGGAWSFTEGKAQVYASNGVDPIQTMAVAGGGNFAAVGGNAPTAQVIAAIQPGFLLCGNINDVTVGAHPQGIRWSALGDMSSTGWPLIGSAAAIAASSDWQDVQGPHGSLLAIAPGLSTCNAGLFFETAVFRMLFTGDAKIFDIQPVEKLRGILAPRSLVQVGQVAYFLSPNGFYAFDGSVSQPIGEGKVNKTFFIDADPNYVTQTNGTVDPASGLVFWLYAGIANVGGVPNRILVYNTVLQRFSLITGFSGSSLFLGRSFGVTLDGIDALGYTLDSLPYSLDSPLLAGGRTALAAFGTDNKLGFFSGGNMAFAVETTETQLIPGFKSRVREVRPVMEGEFCNVALAGRNTTGSPIIYGADILADTDGKCPARLESRYVRAAIKRGAGNLVTHIQGAEFVASKAGSR